MPQRNHGRDWPITLIGYANLECRSETCHQVAEPLARLRWHSVAQPRELEKTIELIQQLFVGAFAICHALSLSAANLSLDRILVEIVEESIDIWGQIQLMKGIDHIRAIQPSSDCQRSKGAQLYVTPLFPGDLLLEDVTHDRGSIV